MKTLFTLLSFLALSTVCYAQNIVLNYSFEAADSCPTYINGGSYGFTLGCVGWGQATAGHPDYFNACDTAAASIGRSYPWVGVPNNYLGKQRAYDGKAYMGINTYGEILTHYKEYLLTTIPALQKDTTYKVSIEVSLSDSCEYATNGLGVLFTTYGSPDEYSKETLPVTPQIDYTSYGIISDTVNWITLSGSFVADSAYTYMIIGGFKDAGEMKVEAVNDSPANVHKNAYYYVDAVVVAKLSTTGIINVNNINDVHIYPNPFIDYTILQFSNPVSADHALALLNAQGQIVQQMEHITTDRVRIDRNNLAAGCYYYRLKDENGVVASGKLIIK
jgi:type IX secretion system substrate protein